MHPELTVLEKQVRQHEIDIAAGHWTLLHPAGGPGRHSAHRRILTYYPDARSSWP